MRLHTFDLGVGRNHPTHCSWTVALLPHIPRLHGLNSWATFYERGWTSNRSDPYSKRPFASRGLFASRTSELVFLLNVTIVWRDSTVDAHWRDSTVDVHLIVLIPRLKVFKECLKLKRSLIQSYLDELVGWRRHMKSTTARSARCSAARIRPINVLRDLISVWGRSGWFERFA